jgi:hypothetical protein
LASLPAACFRIENTVDHLIERGAWGNPTVRRPSLVETPHFVHDYASCFRLVMTKRSGGLLRETAK